MNEMTRKATRAMRPSTAHGWGRSAVPKFLTEILGASVRKEWFRFLVLRQPQEGSCITRRNGSESFQNNGREGCIPVVRIQLLIRPTQFPRLAEMMELIGTSPCWV